MYGLYFIKQGGTNGHAQMARVGLLGQEEYELNSIITVIKNK